MQDLHESAMGNAGKFLIVNLAPLNPIFEIMVPAYSQQSNLMIDEFFNNCGTRRVEVGIHSTVTLAPQSGEFFTVFLRGRQQ